jgi:hypothetical protein
VAQQKILLMAITAAVSGALEKNKRAKRPQRTTQAADHVASTISNTEKSFMKSITR